MRKIIFHLDAGFAGMNSTENALVEDDATNDDLDQEAWERAVANAEMYGVYPEEHRDFGDGDDDGWGSDTYSDNIEGWWEDYDPEKHDSLVPGGGNWVWE